MWKRLSASIQQMDQVFFANVLLVLLEMADTVEKVALVRTLALSSGIPVLAFQSVSYTGYRNNV